MMHTKPHATQVQLRSNHQIKGKILDTGTIIIMQNFKNQKDTPSGGTGTMTVLSVRINKKTHPRYRYRNLDHHKVLQKSKRHFLETRTTTMRCIKNHPKLYLRVVHQNYPTRGCTMLLSRASLSETCVHVLVLCVQVLGRGG